MKGSTRHARARCTLAAALAAILAAACGGDPPTSPSESAIELPDGNYTLGIALGTLPPIGGSPTFCNFSETISLSAVVGLPVVVSRSGQNWAIRMAQPSGPGGGTLTMTLTAPARSTVSGSIGGSARTADDTATVAVLQPSQTLSGTQPLPSRLAGQIDGDVRLETAQGSLTCRSISWTLAPR